MHYLLTLDFPPPYNIGERVLASNIAKVLSRIPLSNLTILCRANHTSDYNLVYVQRTGNEYVDSARIAIRFKKICEEGEYAIVHLININYSVVLPIIKALMKTHLSLIIYFYLLEHYSYLKGFKKILKCLVAPRFCSNFADIAIGTSPLIVKYLSMLGFKQIRYIPPPVDCDLFKPINKLKAQQVLSSKFNMNIKEDSFILLYMGHLTPTRFPYASIMKAIKETIRDGISIQFLIFAPRFWYNEVHARKIRILSEFMNLKEHVNIHIQCSRCVSFSRFKTYSDRPSINCTRSYGLWFASRRIKHTIRSVHNQEWKEWFSSPGHFLS
jgi:hypothetical protein